MNADAIARDRPGPAGGSYAYVGSRTSRHREGRGKGVEVFHVSADLATWTHVDTVAMPNPSYLVPSRSGRYLYAVQGDAGSVRVLRRDERSGRVGLVDEVDSGGTNPVHAALTPDGRYLLVANHNSGTVAALAVRDDEGLGAPVSVLELDGELGPHRRDQNGSKPHQIVFDPSGQYILVPDKGMDSIFVLEVSEQGDLTMDPGRTVRLREMSGPRHIAFHPDARTAYSIEEFRSTVTAYDWDASRGRLTPRQVVSSLPEEMTAESRGAEIAVDAIGRRVYISNRGGPGDASPGGLFPDTIGVFDVVEGSLRAPRWRETAGVRPRFFTVDPTGSHLVVAHERGHSIAVHPISPDTGDLGEPRIVVSTGSPVAIVILPIGPVLR